MTSPEPQPAVAAGADSEPRRSRTRRRSHSGIRCRRCWSRWAATISTPDTPRRPRASAPRGPARARRPAGDRPGGWPWSSRAAWWSGWSRGGASADREQRAAGGEDQVGAAGGHRPGAGTRSRSWQSSAADLAEQLRATQSELGAAGPLQTVAELENAGSADPGHRARAADRASTRRRPMRPEAGPRRGHPRPGRPAAGQRPVGGRRRGNRDRRSAAAAPQRDPAGRRVDPGGQPPGVLADHHRGDRRLLRACR